MAVRPEERFDLAAVERFLAERAPRLLDGPLEVEQFALGRSNLTFLLRSGPREMVLRRAPMGPVPPRAHDMGREFRVLERLHPAFPLAPEPYVYCDDPTLIGAAFYVMERRRGIVVDRSFPPGWDPDPALHRRLSEAVVRTLVDLHAVDWQAAGLGDIGRPEGYLERQVLGWIGRYEQARTDDVPELEWLKPWLAGHIPPSPPPTVVHNDYKLNNVMLDFADRARITAVLDWEMTTVGDPLSDLATILAYWSEPADAGLLGDMTSVTAQSGFYSRREVAERYAALSGRDLANLGAYLAFGYFKVAVICQQIYARWKRGQTRDPRFKGLGQTATLLIRRAAETAQAGWP